MTHRRNRIHERGYSLTEVLVAVAIFAIVFVAALLVYDRSNQIFSSGVNASDVQQTTRVAFDRMVSELRMAGFDYDRDGYPIGAKKYQQPDEQLEFIHPHAITIRSNLNYETGATDNGRETAYEPGFTTTASTTDDYFPVVTTANSEIVTYFLRSDTASANDDDITFYADVAMPRATHPETGGADETLVTIEDVDLCQDGSGNLTGCLNPPYTLYRVALEDDGTVGTPVPIANNIRNMQLAYFADSLTTVAITPNGGAGQYIASGATTAASITARELRSSVRGIQLTMTGMTPNPDGSYTDPIEAALPSAQQVASALRHRQYRLRSTIVPRNLGKRGIQEIDTRVPGAPRVTSWLYGGCGVARIAWDAPPVGYVDSYVIIYDTSPTGPFNSPVTDAGRNLFGYVGGLDPTQAYYFKVLAKNMSGSTISIDPPGGPLTPKNRTKPEPPTLTSATGNPSGPAGVANDITITWSTPALNVDFGGTAPTWSDNTTALTAIPERRPAYTELTGYEIHRSTTSGFTPNNVGGATSTTRIWKGYLTDAGASSVITVSSDGLTGTFIDNTAKLACTPYYYKVVAYERCITDVARNDPADVTLAISDPSAEIQGSTIATLAPSAPANVGSTAASVCNGTTCDVFLEWDRVKTDTASEPILVPQYTVRRRLCNSSGVCGAEQTFTVTDGSPESTAKMTWQETGIAEPATGSRYHYNVSATHCVGGTAVTSAYSTPDVRVPCAVVSIAPSGTVLEGDGTSTGPWLINSNTATVVGTSNKPLSSATANVYAASGTTVLASLTGTLGSGNLQATFGYNMPGANDTYRIEMLFTDTTGCQTGKVAYVQESPSSCCLFPYKDGMGTVINSTIVTVDDEFITIKLQNMCDATLTLSSLKFLWTVGSPQQNMLVSVTYPNGTVDDFGGVNDSDGSATLTPPAGASISGGGSYEIVLTMSRRVSTSTSTVTNFCATYQRNGVTEAACQVITAGALCP